jgi:hypothetical protein
MGGFMVRANFPNFDLYSMLPMLDEIQDLSLGEFPPQYPEIYNVLNSTKSFEQTATMAGLGEFSQIAETGSMQYDAGVQGYKENFLHLQYGLGYRFSQIMYMNQNFGVLKKLELDLAQSGRETTERVAARQWNRGFDPAFPILDGAALFSASHPSPRQGVGLRSNILPVAADLDLISIQLLLTQARQNTDASGKKQLLRDRRLIVPASSEFMAISLLTPDTDPTTSNRAINPLHKRKSGAFRDYFVYDYWEDQDAWAIQMQQHDLRFYWREKPTTLSEIEFDTRATKRAQWMQFSVGVGGWEGYYGCPGV